MKSNESVPEDLEENIDRGLSLIDKPFFSISGRTGIETLTALQDGEENITDKAIIEEREDVHYISRDVLNPGPGTDVTINRDFKNLVDSIIKNGT